MRIRCASWDNAQEVIQAINNLLVLSRFNLRGQPAFGSGNGGMHIRQVGCRVFVVILGVRLNIKKGYCGNHAGPCRFGAGKKHKTMNFLEGLDWVSFDDMVNDALDSIDHDGNVDSATCIIRKGRARRMDYHGIDGGEFDKEGCRYWDFCGRESPETSYQEGTPGIIGWRMECVESPYEEEASV